jgi:membrane associated rhomboid family serine protease
VLPVKDTMTQDRPPVLTLALLAIVVAGWFVLEHDDLSVWGVLYLAGTGLGLWLFGPAIEDSLGRLRFAAFVIAGGAAGAVAHLAVDSADLAQAAGVGALSAVAGGYLSLFPRGRILTVVLVPFLSGVVELPAAALIGLWAVLQVVVAPGLACVAGFALGLALVRTFVDPERDKRGMPPSVPAY